MGTIQISQVLALYSEAIQMPVRYYDEDKSEVYACSLSKTISATELLDDYIIRCVLDKTDCRSPFFYLSPYGEVYGALPINGENGISGMYITGPGRLRHISDEEAAYLLRRDKCIGRAFEQKMAFIRKLPMVTRARMCILLGMLQYLTMGTMMDSSKLIEYSDFHVQSRITAELDSPELVEPETAQDAYFNTSRALELQLTDIVRNGKVELLHDLAIQRDANNFGKVGPTYARHKKNLYIVATTFVSRAAMEAGMSENFAYSISDFYIQKIERASTIEEIDRFGGEMISSYTKEVRRLLNLKRKLSKPVADTIGYICRFYSEDLSVQSIAKELGYSPNYLGRIFQQETGESVNRYLMKERLDAAKRMLVTTDLPIAEISAQLSLCSASHLCAQFKKEFGITPSNYRKQKLDTPKT